MGIAQYDTNNDELCAPIIESRNNKYSYTGGKAPRLFSNYQHNTRIEICCGYPKGFNCPHRNTAKN